MSKKANAVKEVSKTKRTDLIAIANAVSELYSGAEEHSGLFLNMLAVCKRAYKGAAMPDADFEYVATTVQEKKGWTDKSFTTRKCELKRAFNHYMTVPAAIIKAVENNKGRAIPYTHCLRIAKAVAGGKSANVAAKAATKVTKVEPASRNKAESIKSAKTHINRILAHKALSPAFRSELKQLAAKYDII
jgi:hypothetical protein